MSRASTRFLLSCAAVGVACGALLIPVMYFGTVILATVPWLYGLVAGAYLLPGVVVQTLFRRGGVAVLTTTIGGLAAAPFVPGGLTYVPVFALIGALQEIPFAITAYRYWRPWVHVVTAAVLGVGIGVATFAGFADHRTTGIAEVLHAGSFVVGMLLFTFVGIWIGHRLDRAGVGRGVQLPVDRRRGRGAAVTAREADPVTVER